MKVGVNTLFLVPGEVGGTETYLRQTLLAMAEYFPEVHLVLFTNCENDSVLKNDLARFKQVSFDLLNFAASNRYTRIIREQMELPGRVKWSGADVLWSPGYTAPFFSSCPQIVTIPDMQYKTFPQDLTFLARFVTNVLVNMAVRRCRRIFAISNFAKGEISKYTGVDEAKIDVTYLAADPVFGKPIPFEERRSQLSSFMPMDKPYILSVANTYPHKNMHMLMRVFGTIMKDIPHNLVVVGNPRLGEAEYRNALDSISDKSRVIRLQKLSIQQLVSLYQGCDLFAFPSLYEGFGLPVLEAMLAGVPVVTTKLASIPEVGGDCVFYADCHDVREFGVVIRKVLNMTLEEKRQWCEKAVSRAMSFSWKATADGMLRSFRTVQ
ncbi:MAG: glycosyltransferase family 1 protein [Kiritimatiellae bacterium]|nr:glycosyltransferase family 1 protein [Kiritimatiellia bacterium]MDD5522702.1 glycosyltransferase family 1 protein [Kiritimatiellia bacterium]